jgi:hypothetical protein
MAYQHNDSIIRNPDDPWDREWGTGSMVAVVVAVVIMAGILGYGATKTTEMPMNNSSRTSQPNMSG